MAKTIFDYETQDESTPSGKDCAIVNIKAGTKRNHNEYNQTSNIEKLMLNQ